MMDANIAEALRQERLLEDMQHKSKQELMRMAWEN